MANFFSDVIERFKAVPDVLKAKARAGEAQIQARKVEQQLQERLKGKQAETKPVNAFQDIVDRFPKAEDLDIKKQPEVTSTGNFFSDIVEATRPKEGVLAGFERRKEQAEELGRRRVEEAKGKGEPVRKFVKEALVEFPARTAVGFGLKALGLEEFRPGEGVVTAPGKEPEPVSKISPRAQEFLFGKEPIRKTGEEAKEFLKEVGVKPETAERAGLPIGIFGVGLAVIPPIGSGARNLLKESLKRARNVGVVRQILQKAGVADDLVEVYAPRFVEANTDEAVETGLKSLSGVLKETRVPPGVARPAAEAAIPKSPEPLAQEARKYKTAEEFVSSQKPIYRGGKEFVYDPKLDTGNTPFTTEKSVAEEFANKSGGVVNERYISPSSKVLDASKIDTNDFAKEGYKSLTHDNIIEYADLKGYDAVDFTANKKGIGAMQEIQVINPDKLLTKSQLTDFYNQAVGGIKEAPIAPRAPEIPLAREAAEEVARVAPKAEETISNVTKAAVEGRTGKVVKQQFRSDKLDLAENITKGIEQRVETLGFGTRQVRTFAEMEEAAMELGTDVAGLLRSTKTRITDAESLALKNLINTNAKVVARLEKEVIEDATKSTLNRPKILQLQNQIDQAIKKLIPGGTEAGRTVAAFRILARETMEPQFWLRKAKRVLGGRELTDEMTAAIFDLIEKGDQAGLASFVSMLRKPSFVEKAVTLWKAGLLTAPTTHLANIQGNLTMQALMTASDVASAGFDVMFSLATGKRTTTFSVTQLSARGRGLAQGVRDAGAYLKTGVYDVDIMAKYDLPRQVNFENKILNGYTQGIFRSLGAEDIVFRKATWSAALQQQAEVIAKNERLSGQAFKNRVRELLLNPTNEMAMNAIDAAEYSTFQNPNALAEAISAAKARLAAKGTVGGDIGMAILEIIAPFTKTPTNIAARIADFSPVGFFKAVISQLSKKTRGQKALSQDLGRAITGTSVMALGAWLYQQGVMIGSAPETKAERDVFFAEGKQASSIRIGDWWFQLRRVSPIGNLLSLGADFQRLSEEKEGAKLLAATAGAGAKELTEQTFLRGVAGFTKAITEPERSAEIFLESTAGSVVPAVVGRLARTFDPTLRVRDNVLESIQSRIPGLTEGIPPRRDIFGEEITTPSGRFAVVDPFNVKRAVQDPVIDEAKRVGATISVPGGIVDGIKMTPVEFSEYQRIRGKLVKVALDKLIGAPEYQQLGRVQQEKEFSKAIEQVGDEVNKQIFPALMIVRYGLPRDTNPMILREVLKAVSGNKKFKGKDAESQAEIIKKLIEVVKSKL